MIFSHYKPLPPVNANSDEEEGTGAKVHALIVKT